MTSETKAAFKSAISSTLQILRPLEAVCQRPVFVWTRTREGGWVGDYPLRTSLGDAFAVARDQVEQTTSEFSRAFFAEYPQFAAPALVGIAGLGGEQLAHQPSRIVSGAIHFLWQRVSDFEMPQHLLDTVADDLEAFADNPVVQIRFQTVLLNFSMPQDQLYLGDGLEIRRLTEKEVSLLYGGESAFNLHRNPLLGLHEFAFEGVVCATRTASGDGAPERPSPMSLALSSIRPLIQALRIFKEGLVGFDRFHFYHKRFCPVTLGSYGLHEFSVRPGVYRLSCEEATAFPAFAQAIRDLKEAALQTASTRLADAETRFRPEDQILDAVIGMEAILLAGLGNDRGELKFRFSMNYSTLFDNPEARWNAYRVAKDLYDLRSKLAHGSSTPAAIRIGQSKLTLHQASVMARGELRTLVKRFLPQSGRPTYRDNSFWERACFALPAGPSETTNPPQ